MQTIITRLKRLESIVRQKIESLIVGNDDEFMEAVVGDGNVERYKDSNGGYDFLKALSDTAADDWKDYEADNRSE